MPSNTMITVQTLQTLQPKDITECVAHLGKEKLPEEETDFIWQTLVQYYNGTGNVPSKVLMLLHWITPALTPEDFGNISFSNIDVVQNFGLDYNLNEEQISALAAKIREDYAGKEPQDYTYYDLVALRQILCGFNRTEIERIHPSAYREAASVIGKLQNCQAEVMQGFATLAVQPKAFGLSSTWSPTTVEHVGTVGKFLILDKA